MAVAGVVRRDVLDDAHPPAVGLGGQPAQRVVTAEHRVDPVEGRRVVPMVRPGGEERSQVEDVRTQALEVVEVVGDPVQVAAVEMSALVLAPDSVDRLRPARGDRPVGHAAAPPSGEHRTRGLGEPVREDLVDDGVEGPVRRRPVVGDQPEVAGVRDITQVQPGAVEPGIPGRASGEDPPVARDRIVAGQPGPPPRVGAVRPCGVHDGRDELRLAVGDRADVHVVQRQVGRDTQPHADHVSEPRCGLGDVERGAVVVGGGEKIRDRVPGHLTDPAVIPLISCFWPAR